MIETIGLFIKILISLPLVICMSIILFERREFSITSLTIVILCQIIFYLQMKVYYILLIFFLSLIFLPIFFALILVLNRLIKYFKSDNPLQNESEGFRKELRRKIFHLLLILVFFLPITYFGWFFDCLQGLILLLRIRSITFNRNFTNLLLFATAGMVLPSLLVEVSRFRGRVHINSYLLRDEEEKSIEGYVFFLSSVSLLSLYFTHFPMTPEKILIGCVIGSSLYDMSAALTGCLVGKTFIRKNRSLEGVLGGAISTSLLSSYFLNFVQTLILVIVLCFIDLIKPPIDDNLTFPLITTFSLLLVTHLI